MIGGGASVTPDVLLNGMSSEEAGRALERCCGSSRWVAGMLAARPFASVASLHRTADEVWAGLGRADFLEAFSHHPAIGAGGANAAPMKMTAWSSEEQARAVVSAATASTTAMTAELRALNEAYAARFGHIFIVCATGKTAAEIVALLRVRLDNDDATELAVAATEQAAITHLRLEKLARMTTPSDQGAFTCHVLDTALGRPAQNVTVTLEVRAPGTDVPGQWTVLAEERTDQDGRVGNLLGGHALEVRVYRVTFETGAYFRAAGRPAFYPRVQVEVAVTAPGEHYHIPLLLSPFGYSTYRGS